MHVKQINSNRVNNLGLHIYCNNNYALVPVYVDEKLIETIQNILKVKVYKLSIAGTDLLGVFCAGNDDLLLLPEIVYADELRLLDEFKIKYKVIKTRHTALGNLVVANKNGVLVSSKFSAKTKKEIRESLNLNLRPADINELPTVGSLLIVNNNYGIIASQATDKDISYIEESLRIKLSRVTINIGSDYLKSAIISNDVGFLINNTTSGFEISNIDEGLGFLKED